jgi:hypothetical protein
VSALFQFALPALAGVFEKRGEEGFPPPLFQFALPALADVFEKRGSRAVARFLAKATAAQKQNVVAALKNWKPKIDKKLAELKRPTDIANKAQHLANAGKRHPLVTAVNEVSRAPRTGQYNPFFEALEDKAAPLERTFRFLLPGGTPVPGEGTFAEIWAAIRNRLARRNPAKLVGGQKPDYSLMAEGVPYQEIKRRMNGLVDKNKYFFRGHSTFSPLRHTPNPTTKLLTPPKLNENVFVSPYPQVSMPYGKSYPAGLDGLSLPPVLSDEISGMLKRYDIGAVKPTWVARTGKTNATSPVPRYTATVGSPDPAEIRKYVDGKKLTEWQLRAKQDAFYDARFPGSHRTDIEGVVKKLDLAKFDKNFFVNDTHIVPATGENARRLRQAALQNKAKEDAVRSSLLRHGYATQEDLDNLPAAIQALRPRFLELGLPANAFSSRFYGIPE